jgi:hypothetical protein
MASEAGFCALVGAAKSGTSTLAQRLHLHPQITLGVEKELDFFSFDHKYAKGRAHYDALFPDLQPGQFRLDASTTYARVPQLPGVPARIRGHFPTARIVYLLRNPIERAYSHYVHRFSKELHPGRPFDRTFEQHVADDPMCLDSSDYRLQLEAYLGSFPREQILCLFTEDLDREETATVLRTCEFLGLRTSPDDVPPLPRRRNVSSRNREEQARAKLVAMLKSLPLVERVRPLLPPAVRRATLGAIAGLGVGRALQRGFVPPPMRPDTHAALVARFAPMIAWLERFTGRDLSHWSAPDRALAAR